MIVLVIGNDFEQIIYPEGHEQGDIAPSYLQIPRMGRIIDGVNIFPMKFSASPDSYTTSLTTTLSPKIGGEGGSATAPQAHNQMSCASYGIPGFRVKRRATLSDFARGSMVSLDLLFMP